MSITGLTWFKSSYSGSSGDNCLEVAVHAEAVLVRDSKDIRKPALAVSPDAWSAFTTLAVGSRV
ncbi:hypothetical protein QF026_006815 [Streptomyces aurantiacus]|uniref:DUF397 domain-containing protein n=1 Tax=Streptomyces aurantiacus TaxID=47760 RepID=UPI0027918A90|nr:DUF397 domain-containing protein [Streptomyces aurantiacus]MDQ0778349.1 hypothetical protein [Streptomyces aurantiacus]